MQVSNTVHPLARRDTSPLTFLDACNLFHLVNIVNESGLERQNTLIGEGFPQSLDSGGARLVCGKTPKGPEPTILVAKSGKTMGSVYLFVLSLSF
jgi:hypothetical protein